MKAINCPYELSNSTDDESDYISNEVMHSNNSGVPLSQKKAPIFKHYVLKDKNKVIAGINAYIYCWGIMYIDALFVAEAYRNKQLGTYLMNKIEQEAKALGTTVSNTTTFDYQAKDFYIKQGYEIFGVLENCPPNHHLYFLKKAL
jgi:GNAT superfamily N-acetyltransferase